MIQGSRTGFCRRCMKHVRSQKGMCRPATESVHKAMRAAVDMGHRLHVAKASYSPGYNIAFCTNCAKFTEIGVSGLSRKCAGLSAAQSVRKRKLSAGMHPILGTELREAKPACVECIGISEKHSCRMQRATWCTPVAKFRSFASVPTALGGLSSAEGLWGGAPTVAPPFLRLAFSMTKMSSAMVEPWTLRRFLFASPQAAVA